MMNLELLPLPVLIIAFVNKLYDNFRVTSLPVSRIACVNILLLNKGLLPLLYDELIVASPTCFKNYICEYT